MLISARNFILQRQNLETHETLRQLQKPGGVVGNSIVESKCVQTNMTLADLNQSLNSDPPDEPSEIENLTEGNFLDGPSTDLRSK